MTFRAGHVDELISASLTGDLTDAERVELDAHLARCEQCRATLAAFRAERRILSGMPAADPPRDLAARVRAGIESGRFAGPWWRGPRGLVALLASASAVAVAVLAIMVLGKQPNGPVGQQTSSPRPSVSAEPSSSVLASAQPSIEPTGPPLFVLGPGELGYLSLNGAPFEAPRLTFINDATGASIEAGLVSGPPIAASLSPDGRWLAYITQKGETGANEVWILNLVDGSRTNVGCSMATTFTDRLAWHPDSGILAYTLVAVDLGPASGCPANDSPPGSADAWEYEVEGGRGVVGSAGNTFVASFTLRATDGEGALFRLLVSHAAPTPWTESVLLSSDAAPIRIDDIFLPLVSPDGNRSLFWSGSMTSTEGSWQFSKGGMPQLSGDFRSTGPASPWLGTQLLTDLIPVGGEAFEYGRFTWGLDSDLIAFWNGAWTGAPQASGGYPNQQDVYVGRISTGLLSSASRLPLSLDPDAWIVDVAFAPDGSAVAVTIGLPSAGIGDPPSAYLQIVPLDGGEPRTIGGGVEPPPWDGPAVYGR